MASPLRVFTGRYADRRLAVLGLVPIGITRYPPRFPLGYKLRARLSALAPTAETLALARNSQITPARFRTLYLRQLGKIGVERIVADLRALQGDAPGLVLLCFEDVHASERCHRRDLAAWLEARVGLSVPELPPSWRPVARRRSRSSRPSPQLDLFPKEDA